ncbi:NUDIX hydrolase [Brevibacillus humidisoli]|uniref:NUDIX hydrolase n=1 Tax=Brevibacillus humidisoli TaxID=2895522 RepID=UPI001E605C56|nr:NUDIX hydrolase [Brevibacillus humidisoli]UFJ40024.1 NUDIX hydrolase [Brevibacillus humidisoli]
MSYKWLEWSTRLQAIAQAGLTFSKDAFDRERFEELRRISVQIMAEYSQTEMCRVSQLFANEKGYPTPKVDVRGVVFQDDKILMVKEMSDGAWALPGGYADIGYTPGEIAVKEVKEETGYEVVPVKLLAVLDMRRHSQLPQPYHFYKIFIQCRITGGSAVSDDIETSDVGFFPEQELPILSERRNTKAQIHLLFEYLRDPDKVCVFD